mgnify:CR=1 FL=1
MKQKMFVFLLIFQAIIICLVPLQHYLIDDFGETIVLQARKSPDMYYSSNKDFLYIDYDINEIPEENWDISRDMDYQEKVYVVLRADEEGIYRLVRVTDKKPRLNGDEFSLTGKFGYFNDHEKRYRIEYGVEQLDWKGERPGGYKFLIHLEVAPWGQRTVSKIEPYE